MPDSIADNAAATDDCGLRQRLVATYVALAIAVLDNVRRDGDPIEIIGMADGLRDLALQAGQSDVVGLRAMSGVLTANGASPSSLSKVWGEHLPDILAASLQILSGRLARNSTTEGLGERWLSEALKSIVAKELEPVILKANSIFEENAIWRHEKSMRSLGSAETVLRKEFRRKKK